MLLFLSLSLLLMIEDTSLIFLMWCVYGRWCLGKSNVLLKYITLLLREEKTQGETTTTMKTDNNSYCWVDIELVVQNDREEDVGHHGWISLSSLFSSRSFRKRFLRQVSSDSQVFSECWPSALISASMTSQHDLPLLLDNRQPCKKPTSFSPCQWRG